MLYITDVHDTWGQDPYHKICSVSLQVPHLNSRTVRWQSATFVIEEFHCVILYFRSRLGQDPYHEPCLDGAEDSWLVVAILADYAGDLPACWIALSHRY